MMHLLAQIPNLVRCLCESGRTEWLKYNLGHALRLLNVSLIKVTATRILDAIEDRLKKINTTV